MASIFETEVRNGLKQVEHTFFYSKFFDNPHAYKTSPFDFFVLSKDRGSHAIECKYSKNDIFTLGRVKDHQRDSLRNFQRKAGYSWILVGLKSKSTARAWRMTLDEFEEIEKNFKKKSLTTNDFEELKIPEIKRIKYEVESKSKNKRPVYGWDMTWILGYSSDSI